ncbi:MAG: radical SAM protein [Candidatus Omnitrophica bacterium]|nr:radical SAM protein [Candidatus Omnitrophota bacterium]
MKPGSRDSFFSRLKERIEKTGSGTGKPFFCDLLISEKCNSRCRTCYFWKNGIEERLTLEECKGFISGLSGLAAAPFEINLGGGEPLLNEGILELVKHCRRLGLQPTISTNAMLIDGDMARRLSESGLHRLSLSLKGFSEKTHDFLTGVDGSYRKFMAALEHLRRYWRGKDLNIHTIILEQNLDEIIGLTEWVNKDDLFTGIAFQALSQPFRTDQVDNWHTGGEYSYLWPGDSHKVNSVLDALVEFKSSGYRILNPLPQLLIYKRYYQDPGAFARVHRCNSGDYIFNVNVLGLVHLCCFMQPIGNINKSDIKAIWHSREAASTREAMHNCQKSCNNILNCYFQEEGDEGAGSDAEKL